MANSNLPKWETVRPRIQQAFVDAGIDRCELQLPAPVCKDRLYPTLAHSKKRVDIYTLADLECVILACTACHAVIEHLGKRKIFTMEEIVERVRAARVRPVRSVFAGMPEATPLETIKELLNTDMPTKFKMYVATVKSTMSKMEINAARRYVCDEVLNTSKPTYADITRIHKKHNLAQNQQVILEKKP